jgi:hypothetical protein
MTAEQQAEFSQAGVPMPVSETANSTKLLRLLTFRAASLTSPACRNRIGSTVNAPRFS